MGNPFVLSLSKHVLSDAAGGVEGDSFFFRRKDGASTSSARAEKKNG